MKETKRRITFEYSLVKGVNDTRECADELIQLLSGINCHVNLIPVNDVAERGNVKSSEENIYRFADVLKNNGI